ncbi:MAG TPA: diguanylate cyclase [Verrucomicrobiae bacterium]|nr:diguanylate cyclase [Verrucomicrobiae bacterium]
MAHAANNGNFSYLATVRPETTSSHRRCPLRVLFVHRDPQAVDSCLQELQKGQFIVSHDSVLNWTQCTEHLQSQPYDLIIAEYLGRSFKGPGALHLFRQAAREVPLIFLVSGMARESFAALAVQGAFEYVQREDIAHLPMAVRRALNEKQLRSDLAEAERALLHSQSLYRALVENPAYGICRCDAAGKLIEVNQAFLAMLGYDSKEELLAANREAELSLDLGLRMSLAGAPAHPARGEPIEVEWKRKNGTILKARLSGRDAFDEHGKFNGCEIITVDITEQRRLEAQLRLQASTDSLTGLANHGRLLDVLHAEVSRSKRTGREFSIVLLDLDGLKNINDRFGHLAGNRALCRVAQILKDCCRSIDTAARHGGDEFAVVLPETSAASAALVARRIFELLGAEAEQPHVSVSLGIASYPADADGIGALLQIADQALYAMKSQNPRTLCAAAASVPASTAAHPEFRHDRHEQRAIRRREGAQE